MEPIEEKRRLLESLLALSHCSIEIHWSHGWVELWVETLVLKAHKKEALVRSGPRSAMLDLKLEKKSRVELNSKKRCVSFLHLQSLKLTACCTRMRFCSSVCKAHTHTGNTQVTCFSSTPPAPTALLPPPP